MHNPDPMISPVITERTRRFLGMWLRQFAFCLSMIALGISIGCLVGYLLVVAIHAVGLKPVLISMAVLWVVALAATVSGAMAESRLTAAERQEAEVMRKLSRDIR